MSLPNDSELPEEERNRPADEPAFPAGRGEYAGPPLIAYIFLVGSDAEVTLRALRELATRVPQSPDAHPVQEETNTPRQDSWLSHADAAEVLGISESTLYRYAEQEKIECRKLYGRLQYRLSSLDKFKEQRIRPARRPLRSRAIISAAPTSGK